MKIYDANGVAKAADTAQAHNILSATHSDSTGAAVVRGDLITGQGASPAWARLALGGGASYLRSDGTDAAWSAIQAGDVPDGADATAIHDNVSGEISLLTEKVTPVNADLVIIEDSAAANAKKKVQVGNLPGGGGGGDNITVNGAAATDADFDDATPAAPLGSENVVWQSSGASPTSVSAYPKPSHWRGMLLMGG